MVTLCGRRAPLIVSLVVMASAGSPASGQVTTTTYGYDPQGQVTSVSRPSGQVTYSYDAAANRTSLNVVESPMSAATKGPAALSGMSVSLSDGEAQGDPLQALVSAARAKANSLMPPFTASPTSTVESALGKAASQ